MRIITNLLSRGCSIVPFNATYPVSTRDFTPHIMTRFTSPTSHVKEVDAEHSDDSDSAITEPTNSSENDSDSDPENEVLIKSSSSSSSSSSPSSSSSDADELSETGSGDSDTDDEETKSSSEESTSGHASDDDQEAGDSNSRAEMSIGATETASGKSVNVHYTYITYHNHQPTNASQSFGDSPPGAAHQPASIQSSSRVDSAAPRFTLPYPMDTDVAFKQTKASSAMYEVHKSYGPVEMSLRDHDHTSLKTIQSLQRHAPERPRTNIPYERPMIETSRDNQRTHPYVPAPNTILLDAIFSAVTTPSGSAIPHLFEHLQPLTTIGVTRNANGEAYMIQSGMQRYRSGGDVSLWWAPGEAPLRK
jgi:hypothetical protein